MTKDDGGAAFPIAARSELKTSEVDTISGSATDRWTNGKPFVATDKHLAMRWNCGKPGEEFRCALCGHKFVAGDTVRWQFTNDIPGAGGNPFVCRGCDSGKDGIVNKIMRKREELRTGAWWWFMPRELK